MNLVRSRSWGQVKPPPGSTVDWTHPLAQGLAFVLLGGSYDPIGQQFIRPDTGTPVVDRPTVRGSGLGLSGSDVGVLSGPLPPLKQIVTDFTLVTGYAHFNSYSGGDIGFWYVPDATDSALEHRLIDFGSNRPALSCEARTAGGQLRVYANHSGSAAPYLGSHMVASVRQAGVGFSHFRDGTLLANSANSASSSAMSWQSPPQAVKVGHSAPAWNGTVGKPAFPIWFVGAWSRQLKIDDLQWLAAEPYAFIQPPGPKALYLPMDVPAAPAPNTGQFFPFVGT